MPAIRTAWGAGLWGVYDPDVPETWQGTPLILEELTGQQRKLELRDRALPFQPIEWPMNRRVRTWRYDGQPAATQHVMGYDLGSTTIRGQWRAMELAAADLATWTEQGGEPQRLGSVEDLRDRCYDLVRAGQRLAVRWAGLQRETSDLKFTPRMFTRELAEWEMSFEWAGETKVIEVPALDPVADAPFSLFDLISDWLDMAAYPANLALDLLDYVHVQANRIEALVKELEGVVNLYTTGVESLLGVALRAVDILETVKGSARGIRDRVLGLAAPAAVLGITDASPAELAVQARIQEWLATTGRQSTAVVAEAQRKQELFLEVSDPRLEGIVITQGPTDLRHVALNLGWPAEDWKVLADYNDLVGAQVEGGTTILVPAQRAAA